MTNNEFIKALKELGINPTNIQLKQLEEYKEECKKNKVEAKVVLIHAVSVGESNSALPIVSKLLEKNFFVVFTTTTVTSANLIKQKLQKNFIHQYCVYPNKTFIQRFYNNWRPTKVFFVESEIFPSIVSAVLHSIDPKLLPDSNRCRHYSVLHTLL